MSMDSLTSSALDSMAVDCGQLPAPPDVIRLPVVKGKKGAKAIKAPSAAFFAPAFYGPNFVTVLADTDARQALTVGLSTHGITVDFVGENDRTLTPAVTARKGATVIKGEDEQTVAFPSSFSSVDAGELESALEFVSLAMSKDETRYNLNGVYFDGSTYVATDGHRLHLVEEMPALFPIGAIVPAWTVAMLLKAIRWTKAPTVRVAMVEQTVYFETAVEGARVTIAARRVDGQFLDYTQGIPSLNGSGYDLWRGDAARVRAAIKAAPVIGDKCEKRGLVFKDCGVATFRHDNMPIGLPLVGPAVPPLRLSLNARYFDDALSCLEGETVVHACDDLSPVRIDNGSKCAVVMPMRR